MNKINFENLPSTNTPVNAQNLNLLQTNIENGTVLNDKIINNVNCNNVDRTCILYTNSATNAPQSSSKNGFLFTKYINASYIKQEFSDAENDDIYVRSKNQSTWTDWKKINLDKNIITLMLNEEFNVSAGGEYKRVSGFQQYNKIGNKLFFDNTRNTIVITGGVSKVKVSAKLGWYTDTASVKYGGLELLRVGRIAWSTINVGSGAFGTDTIPEILVNVQEGDEIYMNAYSDTASVLTTYGRTFITVEVVE